MTVLTLEQALGDALLIDEPLAKYTAARIGGAAEMLTVAHSVDALRRAVSLGWEAGVAVRVIGGGANVLVSDMGVAGLVVVNKAKGVVFSGEAVEVASGVSLTALANQCATRGLAGFEWAVSVPGTVGGAAVNNAGAHGSDMNDSVEWVSVVDGEHGERRFGRAEMAYGYRSSALKGRVDRRFLVLRVGLQLKADDPEKVRERMAAFRAHRKQTQPPGASLGSIFKNPPGDYAGRLIESAGLKGYRIGGAAVSEVHANFFINADHAMATDYNALILYVQREVERQYGIRLEPEIERVGEF